MRGSEFADLKAFAAIAEYGSFSSAARTLGISPSALSQRMREFEARLDVRLLNRTTRSVALTKQGQALLDSIVPLFAGFDQAIAELTSTSGEVGGLLRLNISRVAAMYLLGPHLKRFHDAHPAVTLDITIEDVLSDIVAGRFDAGIRLGETLEKDMVAVRIGGRRESMVVASPDLIKRLGGPESPRDLHRFPCIRFRWPGAMNVYRWEFERAGETLEVDVEGPLISNDTAMMLTGAEQGLGLAYLLDVEARERVEEGRLVRLLADWTPPFDGFYLYHPSARQMPKQLRAFIDFLTVRVGR
ncbi:LysR family transcriptional regulator [Mesorhizobium loti]|uniref:LysR family transcriptional regulator n=1 Tax=Rhizobium loti TaxID=381 RepID=A0A6M7U4M6_RHILI|nr:LysR family transcriptional regulator [Mesorhizobium loti]OBQ62221.1 LysR family transcriptional regulator [Mesorhizobium loti]QKC71288.1 LysR family transcriptional regulator [Mesorhizobium loti]